MRPLMLILGAKKIIDTPHQSVMLQLPILSTVVLYNLFEFFAAAPFSPSLPMKSKISYKIVDKTFGQGMSK